MQSGSDSVVSCPDCSGHETGDMTVSLLHVHTVVQWESGCIDILWLMNNINRHPTFPFLLIISYLIYMYLLQI